MKRKNIIIEIMSRLKAQQATSEKNAPVTAIISVTDVGSPLNTFYPADWLIDILELQFEDVEFGGLNCITKEHAKEIAGFVLNMHRKTERFIVHCEFGQSRSAGIAAAISEYVKGNDSGILRNRKYNPNRACYDYVLAALKKRGRTPGFLRNIWK